MNTTTHTPFIILADAMATTNVHAIDAAALAVPALTVWEV